MTKLNAGSSLATPPEPHGSPPFFWLASAVVLVAAPVAVGVCRTTNSSWPTVFFVLLTGLVGLIRKLRHL